MRRPRFFRMFKIGARGQATLFRHHYGFVFRHCFQAWPYRCPGGLSPAPEECGEPLRKREILIETALEHFQKFQIGGAGIFNIAALTVSHCQRSVTLSSPHVDSSRGKCLIEPAACYTHCAMLKETLEQGQARTDTALDRLIPLETQHPVSIHKAMRHSVFAGGKRLRPVLCMEAGRMIAGSLPKKIEELGAALEMLHTYSLIHDDLPALDNDDLRRGRPTCHKVFGDAIAILAGDALQTQAYEVLARLECPAEARVRIIEEIARGTGTLDGMIGGQVVDLEAEQTTPTAEMLEYIHRAKTAALITASLVSGGTLCRSEGW